MNMPSILPWPSPACWSLPSTRQRRLEPFQPPAESSLPDNAFGEMVRQGQALFVETRKNAPHLVGNQLNCVNCHLDQGRRANSAPQWAAYPVYPAFRARTTRSIRSPSACRAASSSA